MWCDTPRTYCQIDWNLSMNRVICESHTGRISDLWTTNEECPLRPKWPLCAPPKWICLTIIVVTCQLHRKKGKISTLYSVLPCELCTVGLNAYMTFLGGKWMIISKQNSWIPFSTFQHLVLFIIRPHISSIVTTNVKFPHQRSHDLFRFHLFSYTLLYPLWESDLFILAWRNFRSFGFTLNKPMPSVFPPLFGPPELLEHLLNFFLTFLCSVQISNSMHLPSRHIPTAKNVFLWSVHHPHLAFK